MNERETDPVDEMMVVLRDALRANDLMLWSASGADAFNGDTALEGLARGLLARKVAEPSRTLDAARAGNEGLRELRAAAKQAIDEDVLSAAQYAARYGEEALTVGYVPRLRAALRATDTEAASDGD